MEVKIESAIPMPRPRGDWSKMKEMKVGDSFLVEPSLKMAVSQAASKLSREMPGVKFTTRMVEDGYRTWRVA